MQRAACVPAKPFPLQKESVISWDPLTNMKGIAPSDSRGRGALRERDHPGPRTDAPGPGEPELGAPGRLDSTALTPHAPPRLWLVRTWLFREGRLLSLP